MPAAADRLSLVATVRRFGEELAVIVEGLDPAALHPSDAAAVVREVVAVERRLAGLRLACAARAAASSAVAEAGSRSAEHWYAEQTGVGLSAARRSLRTSERLQELRRTREQAMAGALSEAQLDRVAEAASANPRSEGTLLRAAGRQGMRGLAAVCDRAKAAVADERQERERLAEVHRRRFLHHSRTADGAFRLQVHTTPDAGARLMAAVDQRARQLFDDARRQGRREAHAAYQADALVDLVTGTAQPGIDQPGIDQPGPGGPGSTRPGARSVAAATITFLVDAEAFHRGQLIDGERCELAGVGPVPLAMVERYVGRSRIDLVVTRGVDVASVVSLGRTIPRALRVALEVRDPSCVVPGCDTSSPLEIDHIVPFAEGGPTQLSNLCRLCAHHHDLKTYRGWTIRGGPGAWEWRPPGEPADPATTNRTDPSPAPVDRGPTMRPAGLPSVPPSVALSGPPRPVLPGSTHPSQRKPAPGTPFAPPLFDSA